MKQIMKISCSMYSKFFFFVPLLFLCSRNNALPSVRINNENYEINKNVYINDELTNKKIVNDMKEAFKMFPNFSYIKKMIPKMFDIHNPDPAYIFMIPIKENNMKQIRLRRSNFVTPVYPNLTTTDIVLNRILTKKNTRNGRLYRANKNTDNDDGSNRNFNVDEILPNFLNGNENEATQHKKDTFQDENVSILENVRTEKSFIDYVKNLNIKEISLSNSKSKHLDFIKKASETNKNKINAEQNAQDREWEHLELRGWKGSLLIPRSFEDENSFLSPTESSRSLKTNEKELILLTSVNPQEVFSSTRLALIENSQHNNGWDLPGKVQTAVGQLTLVLNDSFVKLQWPITSSRENHRDSDVFIARANDPFGHSTKWTMKNQTKNDGEERHKRGIIELYSMIKCSTGCDPLVFKGYGCFCGLSGSGRPTDGIDRCCRLHDICYDRSVCPSFIEYFVPYLWKCFKGKPYCAIEHGEWGGSSSCAARLCQCDLMLAKCLQKYQCPKRRALCKTSKIRMLQNILMIL